MIWNETHATHRLGSAEHTAPPAPEHAAGLPTDEAYMASVNGLARREEAVNSLRSQYQQAARAPVPVFCADLPGARRQRLTRPRMARTPRGRRRQGRDHRSRNSLAEAYGKFAEEPTRPELERFFYLDDVDRALIGKRRGDQNRLGFALQMCTVRYVGLFLEDPLAVPWSVIEHLGQELGIEGVLCIKQYTERLKTAYEHAWEIRDAYGYHQHEDPEWGRLFRTFLHGRAWTNAEGPVALFNQSVHWLRRNRVLLPGVSVPARQVAEVRGIAEQRLYATVANAARRADASLPGDLVALLDVPEGKRLSELERMRRPPTRTTGNAMKGALERVDEIAAFRLGKVNRGGPVAGGCGDR
ncbi:DUF4158 domain-containing protein [Streptomyces sp. ME19-01-6]|nr:DUF4158 domain-containing protein [Streptomyces sp. ME19-01-6]MDX3225083.1 DUF4158 domain-containing protein [Streptomyces sp. ME19-01-6]